ncbi:hypothetical protein ACWC2T_39420 [Streptomyces sp. NPDC001393]
MAGEPLTRRVLPSATLERVLHAVQVSGNPVVRDVRIPVGDNVVWTVR